MDVRELVRSHPVPWAMAAFLCCFLVASAIVRWDAARNGRRFGREGTTDAPDAAAAALAAEPARLTALRKEHTDTTKEALAYLAANVWVDAGETTAVDFTDGLIHTRSAGEETWEPFAVCSSVRHQRGSDATIWSLAVETPTWREICTLTVPAPPGPERPPARPSLSCRGIASGAALEASRDLMPLILSGPDQATLEAHRTTPEAVRRALATWCADWRPTATTATWDGTILEDFEERVWEVHFGLDDVRASAVTAAVPMDGGDIEVREGR